MGYQHSTPMEAEVMHTFGHGTALDLLPDGRTALVLSRGLATTAAAGAAWILNRS